MKKKEAGEKVTAKQGLLLLFAAVLVIVVCKIVFNVDTKTTLMLSGAIGGIKKRQPRLPFCFYFRMKLNLCSPSPCY